MVEIGEIAKRHRLLVIEDGSQAFGATLDTKPCGSFGDLACISLGADEALGRAGRRRHHPHRQRASRGASCKEPRVGGAWEWHQDYGYWYYNGCLEPKMLSFMIALDQTDAENGCLKLLKGSHKLGRLDHVQVTPGQNTTDPERMPHILAKYEMVDCALAPGDAVIFHGNTLHRSDQNRSDRRRWTFLCCYNAVSNDTFKRDDDRYYVPLEKVSDDAVKKAGVRFASGNQEHFTSKPYVPKVGAAAS